VPVPAHRRVPVPAHRRVPDPAHRLLARAAVAAALLTITVTAAPAGAATIHDIPLPRGSRVAAAGEAVFVSPQGFRRTVDFYERFLKQRGLPHTAVPVYRYRGVTIARFLSTAPASTWLAIHVFHHEGRTLIFVVPRAPLDPSAPGG
jgi:hypothetical protein